MEDNLFENYANDKIVSNDLNQYDISEKYLENKNKMNISKNNRYSNYKNTKSYTTNLKITEKPNQYRSKNYEKQFLYNSFNNINNDNNYQINNNNIKKKTLSKSIRQNDDKYSINPKKLNLYNNYSKMNSKQNRNNSNQAFYSSVNLLSKNIQNQLKKIDEKIINANANLNLDNNPEIENYNTNDNDKELYLDKNQFFGKIKEINDLEYLDVESQEVLNNLVLNNNNIYINENKNIFLNDTNAKNNFSNKNNHNLIAASEKKQINNYNRISLQNRNYNNMLMKQKNLNTDKKGNIRYSKKLSEKLVTNNLSDNKNNNNNLNLGNQNLNYALNSKGIKTKNLYNYNNRYNGLSTQNKYKTFTKLDENNNNIIKFRNSNYTKKFSDKLNISPAQKRFSTLTNNKNDENIEIRTDNNIDIYEQLNNEKNININLRKKLEYMNSELQKKNAIIKNLYLQNNKYKNIVKKLKIDSENKQKINRDLLAKINSYKEEIIKLKNQDKIYIDNNNLLKNKYISELNKTKERMRKYEHENNNLKMLLKKNKERQYSTDISKNNIYNSFINLEEPSKDYSNYREFNKSVNVSRSKNKFNIPIFKKYQEDY